MVTNPLAYVQHLRGAGPSLREDMTRAAALQARIAQLQSELASLEACTLERVRQHWTDAEIDTARQDAVRE